MVEEVVVVAVLEYHEPLFPAGEETAVARIDSGTSGLTG